MTNQINVKLSTLFPDWPLFNQTPNNHGVWENVKFFIKDELPEYDFWVVLDEVENIEQIICPKNNTLLVTLEPPTFRTYPNKYINQFYQVVTCHRYFSHKNILFNQQGHPWHIKKTYDELIHAHSPKKTKKLSIIASNKDFSRTHKARYEFALALKKHFKSDIDLFGRGINDIDDKWDALKDYKYSIAIENLNLDDWLTEKLPDCLLAETFPFYFGCPNIQKYFSQNSYALIDIYDFNKSIKIINEIISNPNHYDLHLQYIREAKKKYLNNLSLFPLLTQMIYKQINSSTHKTSKKILKTIYPARKYSNGLIERYYNLSKGLFFNFMNKNL